MARVTRMEIDADLALRMVQAAVAAGEVRPVKSATAEDAAAILAANRDPHIDGLMVLHSPKIGIDAEALHLSGREEEEGE